MTWATGTGGDTVVDETDSDGVTWRYHTFTTVGTSSFDVDTSGDVEYLIVAGGGGGGRDSATTAQTGGGGGGGGGVLFGKLSAAVASWIVAVGDGGAGTTVASGRASNGQPSSIFGLTAEGGGGGSSGAAASGTPGGSGGSGGGSGNETSAPGAGTPGQGFDGGQGGRYLTNNNTRRGGGGGGAGDFGKDPVIKAGTFPAGAGGDGVEWPAQSGDFYGGGGGGSTGLQSGANHLPGAGGAGGRGGGGNGRTPPAAVGGDIPAQPGTPNTGGGAGGGSQNTAGGSGVVIVRYVVAGTPPPPTPLPVEAVGGVEEVKDIDGVLYKYHTFTAFGKSAFRVINAEAEAEIEYLVVGGGGGGGVNTLQINQARGGGGGGGGVLFGSTTVTPQNYTLSVGRGGTSYNTANNGENGFESSAFGVTALGGGGGAWGRQAGSAGSGSSGGGASGQADGLPGLGTPGQGFDGGTAGIGANTPGGGGGGAGQIGGGATPLTAGDGGNGIEWPAEPGEFFGGGGGGGARSVEQNGVGGLGGGGDGALGNTLLPTVGEDGRGGGGGGGGINASNPNRVGGDGIVIVRYQVPSSFSSQVVATGGDSVEEIQVGNKFYRVHRFTSVGTAALDVQTGGDFEVLVVGGGGAGGHFSGITGTEDGVGSNSAGGGGGAGGVVATTVSLSAGTKTVKVGAGGVPGVLVPDPNQEGESSEFDGLVAVGGGRGGSRRPLTVGGSPDTIDKAGNGGSGGGGPGLPAAPAGDEVGGTGTPTQGNDGGDGSIGQSRRASGGGGGAGAAGQNATTTKSGDGGIGVLSAITGEELRYGGGGGGGRAGSSATQATPGVGGAGGGGNGGGWDLTPTPGQANTGGGGGGGGGRQFTSVRAARAGAPGGSGVVIVRYEIEGVLPTVATGTATEITKTTARLSGEVIDDGGLSIQRGIAVATGQSFNQIFSAIFAGGDIGTYDIEFSGLTAGTTYFFRAFAISAAGRADGDWVSFTTDAGEPPTVITGFASDIDFFGARLSGSVVAEGEGPVTNRGIVVGPREAPHIGQPDVVNLPAGSGLTNFNATVAGLDPGTLYYFRAYAGNVEAGRAYGDTEDFTTLAPEGPTGLSLTMPTVDEDNTSTGTARFQTDPMTTLTYTWQVSAQTSAPFTAGTSAALTVDGLSAGTVEVVGQGAQGTIRFTPTANWFGTATFSYRVSNGFAFSDFETATVTIRPVPDPPSAVIGQFPNFDEDTTAQFNLTWTDVDDIPPGSLSATDGYFIQMRPTAGGAWRWLTEGSPTARLTNVVVRVLNYSTTELRGTFRVEPDANYYGPYGAQVRVAQQLTDEQGGGFLFGPARNLAGVIASVPDAPTRPQPNRMPTAKVGQTVLGTFTTFDPDIEDTSWTFEISAPDANTWGTGLPIPGVGTLTVIDDDLTDQRTQVRLDQTDKLDGPLTYARWTFDTGSLAPTTFLNGTATSVANGSLSALTTGDLGYLTAPVLIANPASGAVDAATAISTNSYFEFTATLPPGINWASLTFKAARGGATTPRGYAIRTSADGYATTLKTEDIPTQRTVFTDFSVPLAGLPASTPVTFRIYVYTPGTGASVEFDDITITGTVAAELPRYEFDLRVTDSSGLVSPTQRVTGLITLPTATVFLQKVTRSSPAVISPLTPLVEVFQLNVVDSLNGIGGADVTVSTDEIRRRAAQLGISAAELLEPGTVELVVAIGTQIVFTGPVGEVEWSATGDRIDITARGLLSYLEERRIGTGTTSFVGEDISDIMWTLIDDAQGQLFGDYAIVDNSTTAGTNLTVDFERRTRIVEALRNLSDADGSVEFWVDPERRFNTAQARGQDRRNLIRLTPGMMEGAVWTNRDEQIATVVTVIGGEDGMGGFFEGTAITTDSAALARYGRRELLLERSELTSDQQCEDYAARIVDEQARRSETIRADIVVTPNRPFSIRDLEVGDIVTVDLRAPDLGQVIGAYRVVNRRLNLVSETADTYRVRLDLVPAPFVNSALVRVKARHNASIVERLAQLDGQQQ